MSDETGFTNDRDRYRYDDDGKLTVWGARDVLLGHVRVILEEIGNVVGDESHATLTHYTSRLHAALDDVQEAVLRCHDAFGCFVGGLGVERDEETGEDRVRFVCRACDEGREAAGYDALAQDEEHVEFNEALRDARRRSAEVLRHAGGSGVLWTELREQLGLTDDELADAKTSLLQWVRGEVMPARTAREEREAQAEDAEEVKRRIRSGVPEPRDETWDAVREVREMRDEINDEVGQQPEVLRGGRRLGTCYDRPEAADQSDQADARDDRGGLMSNPIGWVSTVFQEALVVEAGDVVSVTQVIGSDGRTTSVSATVTRAAELEALDFAETGDE